MARGGELDGNLLFELVVAELNDQPAWERCMDSQQMNDKLLADLELGMLVEVTGTPTLFINGRRVEGVMTREALDERLDEALFEARESLSLGIPRAELYDRLIENGKINDFLGPRAHAFTVKASHRLGAPEAPVTLTLFSDYECRYCVEAAPMLEAAQAHFGQRVSLVYKHFPLSFHPGALAAARASICAGEQNLFWPYHHALLELPGLTDEALKDTAADLGMDLTAFGTCLTADETTLHVNRDRAEAEVAGVRGTPSVFINGRELIHPMGPQVSVLIRVIDGVLTAETSTP